MGEWLGPGSFKEPLTPSLSSCSMLGSWHVAEIKGKEEIGRGKFLFVRLESSNGLWLHDVDFQGRERKGKKKKKKGEGEEKKGDDRSPSFKSA